MTDDPCRVGGRAYLAARPEHAICFLEAGETVFYVVDHVHGEQQVKGPSWQFQAFGAAKLKVDGRRSLPGSGQHLARGVDAPARTADQRFQGNDVIAGAASYFQHLRVAMRGLAKCTQYTRMDPTVAGVCCCEPIVIQLFHCSSGARHLQTVIAPHRSSAWPLMVMTSLSDAR